MFTGIVEELGSVAEVISRADESARLVIHGPLVTSDARPGDSIAVNGVCLTAVDVADGRFSADVMAETLRRSSLGALHDGDPVNLERPMAADGRFGGHIVQGHVDGVGHVRDRHPSEHWEVVEFDLPARLARYLVEKGSITVDGVSLTVVEVVDPAGGHRPIANRAGVESPGEHGPTGSPGGVDPDTRSRAAERSVARGGASEIESPGPGDSWFSVSLIPTTLATTTLGTKRVGDPVNLEVDVIAKYVERLTEARS